MIYVLRSILIWQITSVTTENEKYHRNHNTPFKRSVESTKNNTNSTYDGGISKSLIHFLVPSEQSHIRPYKSSQFSPLLDWANFDKMILEYEESNFESQMHIILGLL